MEIYTQRKLQYEAKENLLKVKYNRISFARIFSIAFVVFFFYKYSFNTSLVFLFSGIFSLLVFVILMRWHSKVKYQKRVCHELVQINTDEINFLNRGIFPYENGIEFTDFNHPYAYDLDIFGEQSLFQSLNRTSTYMGKKSLASNLLKIKTIPEIEQFQEAIKELVSKLDWRQNFFAIARIEKDSADVYHKLLRWTDFNSTPLARIALVFSYLSPILLAGLVVSYGLTSNLLFAKFFGLLFMINLGVTGLFLKRILSETAHSSDINSIVSNYGLLIKEIETTTFISHKAKHLQQELISDHQPVSMRLKQLSELFSKMDNTGNFLVSILFNGFFLFNIHVLHSIVKWKKNHGMILTQSLEVIGEFEMLNSLANFSFNNPDYAFPKLNNEYKVSFENLCHPLLNPKTRVGNTVSFNPQSFMILTGSNMSGKSTFLRSLGVNMVLAGIGAPVCATEALVHPLPVLVSMRLSDSLSDSESYFFAEIKRLKHIMESLEESPSFVLLDEILRGTNSDDKRNGTIEVIRKIIAQKVIGAIATHDIEVCLTTLEFPDILVNKCFEAEIKNDELYFDYLLRDGICQNKSATFLMKKMGVI